MKGKLIVFLASSQTGKDYCADYLIQRANGIGECFDLPIDFRYATAYKVRKRREDDPSYIRCVEDKKEIPVEYDLAVQILDNQTIAYSSSEIEKGLKDEKNSLKGLVICTTSVELVDLLKKKFPNDTIVVLILGGIKSYEQIASTEAERYGKEIDNPIVVDSSERRYKHLEENISQLNGYYEKADYVLHNRWSISRYLDPDGSRMKKEVDCLCRYILDDRMDFWGHWRRKRKEPEEESE